MEKVIDLFNEFMEKEKDCPGEWELITDIFEEDLWWDDWTVLWAFMQNPDDGDLQYSFPEWTSKKFWFIKWLVENREDFWKDYEATTNVNEWKCIFIWDKVITNINWSLTDSIIGALATIDNPIEFLASILL